MHIIEQFEVIKTMGTKRSIQEYEVSILHYISMHYT